jgi:hypothetical protein
MEQAQKDAGLEQYRSRPQIRPTLQLIAAVLQIQSKLTKIDSEKRRADLHRGKVQFVILHD